MKNSIFLFIITLAQSQNISEIDCLSFDFSQNHRNIVTDFTINKNLDEKQCYENYLDQKFSNLLNKTEFSWLENVNSSCLPTFKKMSKYPKDQNPIKFMVKEKADYPFYQFQRQCFKQIAIEKPGSLAKPFMIDVRLECWGIANILRNYTDNDDDLSKKAYIRNLTYAINITDPSTYTPVEYKKYVHDLGCLNNISRLNPEVNSQDKVAVECISFAPKPNSWIHDTSKVLLFNVKFDPRTQKAWKWAGISIFIVLQATMLALGCEITIDEVKKHAKRPDGAVVAFCSQFGVMPLAAFVISRALGLGFYPSIALIICGCCPGGNLSNGAAFLVKGDMNLSILMTTCSSIGGLLFMPLMIGIYGGWTKSIMSDVMEDDRELQGVSYQILRQKF